MPTQKSHLLLFLFLLSLKGIAQSQTTMIPDSLASKGYHYLRENYNRTKKKPSSIVYAKAWLSKAKKDQHHLQMALAYQALLHKSAAHLKIPYADSILSVAKRTGDDAIIGGAYLTKGTVYYGEKNHLKALDHFLLADSHIARTNDDYLKYKLKYTLGQTKYYLGFYHESIALFRECVAYFKQENDRAYLNSLHHLGLCYSKIGHYALSSDYNKMGLEAGVKLENTDMAPYFRHSEGINCYFLKDYAKAIVLLEKSLAEIASRGDFANEIVAWFYLGKANRELSNWDAANGYFRKVDNAMDIEKYIRPDLRENYEILIDQYQKSGDMEKQLYHVKRLIRADSILYVHFRYLSGKIYKEYDTRKLLAVKDQIENKMLWNKRFFILTILTVVTLAAYLIYRQYKKTQYYNRKFDELMAGNAPLEQVPAKEKESEELDIAQDVVEAILKRLEKFEKDRKYLEKDMTSSKLADILHTNTKYVSKIIPRYRDRKTIDYISDLKIAHIIELLKTERRYRNYTNLALAETAGFGSTQNFTRAFKARTGISPTFFINRLKEQELPL